VIDENGSNHGINPFSVITVSMDMEHSIIASRLAITG
jgi:hypothetical protein